MSSKEAICYQILKKYSLIVDFEGEPALANVPEPEEKETYNDWKNRVLGDDISNVVLYAPIPSPRGNTLISTLQLQVGASHLKEIFNVINETRIEQKKSAVKIAIKKTKIEFTSFQKGTLECLISDSEQEFEKPVRDFLDRFLKKTAPNIDAEEIVGELLESYNDAVCRFRVESAKCDRLQSEIDELKLLVKSAV